MKSALVKRFYLSQNRPKSQPQTTKHYIKSTSSSDCPICLSGTSIPCNCRFKQDPNTSAIATKPDWPCPVNDPRLISSTCGVVSRLVRQTLAIATGGFPCHFSSGMAVSSPPANNTPPTSSAKANRSPASARTSKRRPRPPLSMPPANTCFPASSIPHTHIHLPFMGTFSKDTHETASKAALVGGTTTYIEMVCQARNEQPIADGFEFWLGKAQGHSACDFTFHQTVSRLDKEAKPSLSRSSRAASRVSKSSSPTKARSASPMKSSTTRCGSPKNSA